MDLNIKHKTIKLLENNMGENLDDLEFGNGFFFFLSLSFGLPKVYGVPLARDQT